MPKVSDAHRNGRRMEIMTAAVTLFARNGFDGTSMADIIAESGQSAGAIYGHFKSKSDLIQSVVHELFMRRQAEFEESITSGTVLSPAQIIAQFARRMREDVGEPAMLLQVWAAAVGEPELLAMATRLADDLMSVFSRFLAVWYRSTGLDDAAADARARALSPVCLGICQGYMVQAALFPGFDDEAYLASVDDLLGEGRPVSGAAD